MFCLLYLIPIKKLAGTHLRSCELYLDIYLTEQLKLRLASILPCKRLVNQSTSQALP